MLAGKPIAVTLALLLFTSAGAFVADVDAQTTNIKTQITLGLKKDPDGNVTGEPQNALPSLVRVGETRQIFGRIMQIPDGKNLQPLPNVPVKLIDVFNNAQNPIVLATAQSDSDGFFVFEWKISAGKFKELGVFKVQEGITSIDNARLQILAVYDGDSTYAKSTSRGYIVELKPQRLTVSIKTDKQLYAVGESAHVTVTFKNPDGQLVDPDTLDVFFESSVMSTIRQDVGTYFVATPALADRTHRVTVLFDKEEFLREIISATITTAGNVGSPIQMNVDLDQMEYGIGDAVVTSGSVGPVLEGRFVLVTVTNPIGLVYSFDRVTPSADGAFSHEFTITGQLGVTGTWRITFNYLGLQSTEIFNVREFPTKLQRVEVEVPMIVNDIGDPLSEPTLATPVGIQTKLSNNQTTAITMTYIVKVANADGLTVMLSWIKGITLNPNTTTEPAIFWYPEQKGTYDIEVFVWQSLEEPKPFSEPTSLSLSIA